MAPCGPAPDDISGKDPPSQQTSTSYGNPNDAFVWQGTLHSPGRIVEEKEEEEKKRPTL